MANGCKRPLPVEIVGNHWIHREAGYDDANFYRRDEADAVFAELEARIEMAATRADQLQQRLDAVEAKAKELNELGHGIAYDAACSVIESDCLSYDELVDGPWWDVGEDWVDIDAEDADDVAESVKYLEMRGLLDRHPKFPGRVRLRDESEAMPR